MKKEEKAILYFEELRNLVKKCPKNYQLAFDVDKGLFMYPKNSEFDYGDRSPKHAMFVTVGISSNKTKASTDGCMSVVSSPIGLEYIDLAALSSNADF